MQSIAWTIAINGGRAIPAPGQFRLAPLPTCSEFALAITLKDSAGGALAPPAMSSWGLILAHDRDGATPPECVASTVSMEAGVAYAQCDPRTVEMVAAIRAHAANGRLPVFARLTGYDAEAVPRWSVTWAAEFFGEAPAGDDLPFSVQAEYYNRVEVDALLEGYAPAAQAVETIPADAAAYSLADGHAYTHAPAAAPIYTLPDVSAGVTHEITVEVAFSASALSVAFEDAAGEVVPILPLAGDIAAGAVVLYVCRWSPALAAWVVMPILEGGDA